MVVRVSPAVLCLFLDPAPVLFGQEPPVFPTYNRRPYLQSLTSTSVLIVTQSKARLAAVLRYGVDPEMDRTITEPQEGSDHVFKLEGLLPDTVYRYKVSHPGVTEFPTASFRTLPGPGSDITVAAIGDSGTLSDAQIDIATQLELLAPRLLLHTGDMVYPHGSPSNYQEKFIGVYRDLLMRTCIYPVLGNHDCMRGPEYFLYMFHLPANNPNGDEDYYSFDAGDAHFVALNTCSGEVPSEQAAWLNEDLSRATLPWKIVIFHHAAYSNAAHGGTIPVREVVAPILESHDVDLVLTGHDHVYERSFPILENEMHAGFQEPNYVHPGAPIYIVTGGGGGTLYDYNPTEDAHLSAVFRSEYNYLELRITPDMLEGTAFGLDAEVLDVFTIRKGEAVPPPPAFTRGDVDEDREVNLTDAVQILGHLFLGEREVCKAAADVDGTGEISITDAVSLLSYLFQGGPAPQAPFPGCGSAPGADGRGCTAPCEAPPQPPVQ
jgi:hypothetical protein